MIRYDDNDRIDQSCTTVAELAAEIESKDNTGHRLFGLYEGATHRLAAANTRISALTAALDAANEKLKVVEQREQKLREAMREIAADNAITWQRNVAMIALKDAP